MHDIHNTQPEFSRSQACCKTSDKTESASQPDSQADTLCAVLRCAVAGLRSATKTLLSSVLAQSVSQPANAPPKKRNKLDMHIILARNTAQVADVSGSSNKKVRTAAAKGAAVLELPKMLTFQVIEKSLGGW